MTFIHSFTFNPFYENTYIIYNEQKEAWIIDAGAYTDDECKEMADFIDSHLLKPVRLLNTHCHLDHIFGNAFITENYHLSPEWHENESLMAKNASLAASMFGVKAPQYVAPGNLLQVGESLTLGDASFKILFTPGHSPGSVCFYNEKGKYVIAGDVLFRESIGRTDLPGGDYNTLIHSIKNKLLTLPDDVEVYNGHGPQTTIGHERKYNPFLR
ncbi:MAG: MBL fold metallo-hydrolase [Chitinophagales bacterium]|nr:MBL fold metallo-hydrolase [Chitinophagales bacterium]